LSINNENDPEWNDILDINELIERYQEACYGKRSIPERETLFKTDSQYLHSLEKMDICYNQINDINLTNNFSPALIEYTKVLMAYFDLIMEETKNQYLTGNISSQYISIYSD
jgi:Leucine-rich repeat (LRR) protein